MIDSVHRQTQLSRRASETPTSPKQASPPDTNRAAADRVAKGSPTPPLPPGGANERQPSTFSKITRAREPASSTARNRAHVQSQHVNTEHDEARAPNGRGHVSLDRSRRKAHRRPPRRVPRAPSAWSAGRVTCGRALACRARDAALHLPAGAWRVGRRICRVEWANGRACWGGREWGGGRRRRRRPVDRFMLWRRGGHELRVCCWMRKLSRALEEVRFTCLRHCLLYVLDFLSLPAGPLPFGKMLLPRALREDGHGITDSDCSISAKSGPVVHGGSVQRRVQSSKQHQLRPVDVSRPTNS
ncbi:hypothetical protein FH972_024153 [Carpinus fangiana]|uniref:Uncharacterized protein n=1 Tax=Carpinus fangiana TaxID=176857 RepID=A0A5N6KXM4_9ROSI|nr:hypothetical protein FH972_024153 [Carpinus fangiana]